MSHWKPFKNLSRNFFYYKNDTHIVSHIFSKNNILNNKARSVNFSQQLPSYFIYVLLLKHVFWRRIYQKEEDTLPFICHKHEITNLSIL